VTVVSLVAVLRDRVGTSYIVAVLRDRLLRGWAFCLNYNKRGCYVMLCLCRLTVIYIINISRVVCVAVIAVDVCRETWYCGNPATPLCYLRTLYSRSCARLACHPEWSISCRRLVVYSVKSLARHLIWQEWTLPEAASGWNTNDMFSLVCPNPYKKHYFSLAGYVYYHDFKVLIFCWIVGLPSRKIWLVKIWCCHCHFVE